MADLYGAITDDAVNRIINVLHARAPFLFNYVAPSAKIVRDAQGNFIGVEEDWVTCSAVSDPAPGVPKYRRLPPFGLPGVNLKLPYSVQLVDLNIDFHPGGVVPLPSELSPPLPEQRFALQAMVQFGLACVPEDVLGDGRRRYTQDFERLLQVLPVQSLDCFVLQLLAVGRVLVDTVAGSSQERIRLGIDGLEVVDLQPPGLEHAVECYVIALLRAVILPQLVLALERIPVNTLGIAAVTPSLTKGLPHNPAIEDEELRVWLDLAWS